MVLVINNNIFVIGLMFPLSIFQEKSNDGMAISCEEIPQDARNGLAKLQARRLSFYFVTNHFESIGKPILLKGGKVLLVNKLLHVHKCQPPKTPTSSPTKYSV